MKKIILAFLAMMTLALVACSGGDSSSDTTSFASSEKYVGTQDIVFSGSNDIAGFSMAISDSNVVILDENYTATGILGIDGQFSVTSPSLSISTEGITCTGSISYLGKVENDIVFGEINGLFNCKGEEFPIVGNFYAERGNVVVNNKTVLSIILELVQ